MTALRRFSVRRTSSFGISAAFEGVSETGRTGKSDIHDFCIYGDVEAVRNCIKRSKEDINIRASALHNNSPLHVACEHNHVEVVKLLIKKKAFTDAVNDFGNSPLHVACEKGYINIVRELLRKPIELNHPNKYNQTPLHVRLFLFL
jgi:ankyrin repeat protein